MTMILQLKYFLINTYLLFIKEIVECLKELEDLCPSHEDFRHLCALLTLPKLSDHEDLKSWNPSSARMECFYKVFILKI